SAGSAGNAGGAGSAGSMEDVGNADGTGNSYTWADTAEAEKRQEERYNNVAEKRAEDWESLFIVQEDPSEDEKSHGRKRRKQSTGKGILIGILIVLIPLFTFIGVGAFMLKSSQSHIAIVSGKGFDLTEIEAKLGMIRQVIGSAFLFDYDDDALKEKIYAGYVEGLGDPYSCYYTAEEYKAMSETTQGTYYGIGVMISQEVDTGRVSVIRVFSGSPAEEAGIKVGDILAEVAKEEVTGMDLNEVVSRIKGAEGTTVEVKVYREGEEDALTLDVERRQVDVDTVYYKMLDNGIGYLELTEFDSVSVEQFTAALKKLKAQGMKSLILDLRNNPGGLLDVAVSIADELIDKGKIVSIEDKNGKTEVYKAKEKGALDLPLAVLVNGNSASAAEVLSGSIKDYGIGTLIGTQTFGKGIVQTIVPFSDGTAMKITTAHYYTPSGNDIHKVGIKPDVIVEDNKETKDVDEQLQKAIEVLTEGR
ncbi:MAG: S41 family peptidase, partial [Lachnospiraceae bacterium]|nr:S41 family peptidase [Lachnospiraceae bacterium]